MVFPALLFRGDQDSNPHFSREVRALWHTGYLRTNLVDGNLIWSRPLLEFVRQHVDPGWRTTHFLSFSEDRTRAEAFARGLGNETKTLVPVPEEESSWHTSVFTLDTSRLIAEATQQVAPGLWSTAFHERPLQHSQHFLPQLAALIANQKRGDVPVRVLLVDVVSALSANTSMSHDCTRALSNARRDREWLVLPLDPFPDDPSQFTCVLSGSCLSRREKFLIR